MTAELAALVDAALADEADLEQTLQALAAAVDAAPRDASLRRLRLRLLEATWDREAQLQDLRALVDIDPADRDAALALAQREHRWSHYLADDEAGAEAMTTAAAARVRALADAQLADADWTERLLGQWTDTPLATAVTTRLRLALQARARHPQHAGLRRQEALAWADLATTVPSVEPPPGKPPMGVAVGVDGSLQDALASERALAALAMLPPEPDLLETRARLELGLCRFGAAASAFEAAAAAWRRQGDEGAESAAAAQAQAERCRGGRAALVQGQLGDVDELMARLQAANIERGAEMRQQLDELKPAMAASAAEPDLEALQQQADSAAGHVAGGVAQQPTAWVVHDGQGLDPRLTDAMPRWQALGLQHLGWAEAPAYSRQFGAPTVAGIWVTPEGDALLVHIAVRQLDNVDLETEFDDGTQVVTTLARGRNFMGGGPRIDTLHLDHDVDPAEALAVHRARAALAAQGGRTLRPVRSVADFESLQERQRAAKTAYRLAEGLGEFEAAGVPVEPAEHFVPMLRAAVRRRISRA